MDLWLVILGKFFLNNGYDQSAIISDIEYSKNPFISKNNSGNIRDLQLTATACVRVINVTVWRLIRQSKKKTGC